MQCVLHYAFFSDISECNNTQNWVWVLRGVFLETFFKHKILPFFKCTAFHRSVVTSPFIFPICVFAPFFFLLGTFVYSLFLSHSVVRSICCEVRSWMFSMWRFGYLFSWGVFCLHDLSCFRSFDWASLQRVLITSLTLLNRRLHGLATEHETLAHSPAMSHTEIATSVCCL